MIIKPASKIAEEMLSEPLQNVLIRNGHSRVMIPNKTLEKIKHLGLREQQHVGKMLAYALQDASRVILIPRR